jgi:transcriptional regulator with XRE-family HTH domain
MAVAVQTAAAGGLLREWRERRNLSQLQLSVGSAISARHLSFIETGRAQPSREMLLHLAERLEIPLRERNRLLLAAGFAPVFGEHALDDEEMESVCEALERFLAAHQPYPAMVLNRRRNVVTANDAISVLTEDVAPELLKPPMNALRIALHPDGLAPQIVNFAEWSCHLLRRLRRAIEVTGDEELEELYEELAAYPRVVAGRGHAGASASEILLPLRLRRDDGELALFSTMTVFGTALDVTLVELAIESFYPADRETAAKLMARADAASAPVLS